MLNKVFKNGTVDSSLNASSSSSSSSQPTMSPTAASPLPLEEELRQEAADIDAVETTAQTDANFSPSTSDSNNESVSLQQQIVISPITGILLQTDDLLNVASDFAAFTNFYFAYKHRFCGFRLNAF